MQALDYLEPLPEHPAGAPLRCALETLRAGTPIAYADAGGWRLVRPNDVIALPLTRQLCDVPSQPLPVVQMHDTLDLHAMGAHEIWGAIEAGRLLGRIERRRLLEAAGRVNDDLDETLSMVARERVMPKLLHDVNNVLFVIDTALMPGVATPAAREAGAEAVRHTKALVQHMRELYVAREEPSEPAFVVSDVVAGLTAMLAIAARPASLEVVDEIGAVAVRAHRWRFESALLNLVLNASEHGDALVIRVTRPEAACVEVSVDDDGPGFGASELEAVVPEHPGTRGHGLSSIRRQMAAMGGALEIGGSPLGGARVTLRLPAGAVTA